ncbi:MAG: hypothetical protein OXC60_05575 [Litoreibacter sp.]|nr:hypothetical protein [Litoreibacter sp.]
MREPMRVAYILAENLTDEERKLLMGVSSRPMPIDTDDMKALSALRLIEREIGGHTARVTPFGANVISVLQEMKKSA